MKEVVNKLEAELEVARATATAAEGKVGISQKSARYSSDYTK